MPGYPQRPAAFRTAFDPTVAGGTSEAPEGVGHDAAV